MVPKHVTIDLCPKRCVIECMYLWYLKLLDIWYVKLLDI